jgi:hypothetical protein
MYVSENIFCMRIASHMYVFYRPVYRRHSTRYPVLAIAMQYLARFFKILLAGKESTSKTSSV